MTPEELDFLKAMYPVEHFHRMLAEVLSRPPRKVESIPLQRDSVSKQRRRLDKVPAASTPQRKLWGGYGSRDVEPDSPPPKQPRSP